MPSKAVSKTFLATEGPPLDWRVDGLGDGIASLAIADGRIFTSTSYGNSEYAVALDVETGQAIWTTEIGAAVQENLLMRWLSQRTPTVDGTRLYVFTKSGWLVCMDTMSGQIQWRVSYPQEFGTKQGKWGFCDRPLVDGDNLICAPGGTNATLVALDKHSGKRIGSTFPVVSGGQLYLRDNDRLYKYDIIQHSPDAVPPEPRFVTLATPTESKRVPLPCGQRVANAIFVPTPMDVVAKMLEVAQLGQNDLLVDLGSGDGRIVIEAAKQYGCRAVGIELDSDLVTLYRQRVLYAKLDSLATIINADLFETDFSRATVVTAYLPSNLMQRLLPKLQKLNPGSRIVTHQFAIPGLTPVKTVKLTSTETGAEHTIYTWTLPIPKN